MAFFFVVTDHKPHPGIDPRKETTFVPAPIEVFEVFFDNQCKSDDDPAICDSVSDVFLSKDIESEVETHEVVDHGEVDDVDDDILLDDGLFYQFFEDSDAVAPKISPENVEDDTLFTKEPVIEPMSFFLVTDDGDTDDVLGRVSHWMFRTEQPLPTEFPQSISPPSLLPRQIGSPVLEEHGGIGASEFFSWSESILADVPDGVDSPDPVKGEEHEGQGEEHVIGDRVLDLASPEVSNREGEIFERVRRKERADTLVLKALSHFRRLGRSGIQQAVLHTFFLVSEISKSPARALVLSHDRLVPVLDDVTVHLKTAASNASHQSIDLTRQVTEDAISVASAVKHQTFEITRGITMKTIIVASVASNQTLELTRDATKEIQSTLSAVSRGTLSLSSDVSKKVKMAASSASERLVRIARESSMQATSALSAVTEQRLVSQHEVSRQMSLVVLSASRKSASAASRVRRSVVALHEVSRQMRLEVLSVSRKTASAANRVRRSVKEASMKLSRIAVSQVSRLIFSILEAVTGDARIGILYKRHQFKKQMQNLLLSLEEIEFDITERRLRIFEDHGTAITSVRKMFKSAIKNGTRATKSGVRQSLQSLSDYANLKRQIVLRSTPERPSPDKLQAGLSTNLVKRSRLNASIAFVASQMNGRIHHAGLRLRETTKSTMQNTANGIAKMGKPAVIRASSLFDAITHRLKLGSRRFLIDANIMKNEYRDETVNLWQKV
jgi:hypothetical protein